jgi:hypothetical protein
MQNSFFNQYICGNGTSLGGAIIDAGTSIGVVVVFLNSQNLILVIMV